ncbi:MAG TPA: hypothetical protein VMD92_15970 [Acidobacteriaceae bacterium]|jgi:hypothetical protein|nr:hypothetical protein [Acidobacteriaceae bacterium]
MAIPSSVTQIVVPVLSPFVAAIALVVGLQKEIRLFRSQQNQERNQRAHSISTEVFWATAVAGLLVSEFASGHQQRPETLKELHDSYLRIMERLRLEPEIGDYLRDRVKFTQPSKNTGRMFLILLEGGVRVAKPQVGRKDILFVYFTLLTLTYLYETEAQRKFSDAYAAIELIHSSEPEFWGPFLIDRATPSLREP